MGTEWDHLVGSITSSSPRSAQTASQEGNITENTRTGGKYHEGTAPPAQSHSDEAVETVLAALNTDFATDVVRHGGCTTGFTYCRWNTRVREENMRRDSTVTLKAGQTRLLKPSWQLITVISQLVLFVLSREYTMQERKYHKGKVRASNSRPAAQTRPTQPFWQL